MKKLLIAVTALSLITLAGCSNRQKALSPGGAIGATMGAGAGAMTGGMFGLMIAGGGNSKNTSSIVGIGTIIGAISGATSGYIFGKKISK